jgi:N4-(beta-N-acetylglucosaminyl)-L-asparaginase
MKMRNGLFIPANEVAMKPIVIASANGHQCRNGGAETCVQRAFRLMTSGADVLDALVAGVTIVELDPDDSSVGFGGLPNADGVVQLDASCMHGRRRRAAAVAALEGVATAAAVAQRLLDTTNHHLLVGAGAREFARAQGFAIVDDLKSPRSTALWDEWRRRTDARAASDPARRFEIGYAVGDDLSREGLIDPNHLWGTINCNAVNAHGDLAGVTTTSGLAWKRPGRVGDSPVLGAGLYVRQDAGAAGSTGRGESNLYGLSSFLIVDRLRHGAHPADAGMEALREIKEATVDPQLLNERGQPNFNVKFYIVAADGRFASTALYGGDHVQFAVCTENGAELRRCDALLDGSPA